MISSNIISSNTPTLTHLLIHLLHLSDTHLNSYSVPSWYSVSRSQSHDAAATFVHAFVTYYLVGLIIAARF